MVGGEVLICDKFDFSIQYSTKINRTKKTASIKENKSLAACTNYEGKVVVSGGFVVLDDNNDFNPTNSVEVYD